jgi:hypothetical protein
MIPPGAVMPGVARESVNGVDPLRINWRAGKGGRGEGGRASCHSRAGGTRSLSNSECETNSIPLTSRPLFVIRTSRARSGFLPCAGMTSTPNSSLLTRHSTHLDTTRPTISGNESNRRRAQNWLFCAQQRCGLRALTLRVLRVQVRHASAVCHGAARVKSGGMFIESRRLRMLRMLFAFAFRGIFCVSSPIEPAPGKSAHEGFVYN